MNRSERSWRAELAPLASLAVVYVAVAVLAVRAGIAAPGETLIWPASGLALAALMRGGIRLWPGVAVGAFLAALVRGMPPLVAAGVAAGSTVEAVLGAAWVVRLVDRQPSLFRLRQAVALVFAAAAASSLVGASLVVVALVLGHLSPLRLEVWLSCWLGDAAGILVVAPLFLLDGGEVTATLRSRSRLELAALAVAVLGGGWLVFGPSGLPPTHDLRQTYLLLPVMIAAAMRLRELGAAATTFFLSVVALVGTARGYGPFAHDTLAQSAAQLQTFLFIVGASGLLLAASKAQIDATEEKASFLAKTGEILATSLDYETTLDQVAALVVPAMADWCIVDVVDEGAIRRVAVAAADPEKRAVLADLRDHYPPAWDSPQPAGQALRTGKAFLEPRFSGASLARTTRDEQHLAFMRRLDPRSAMALPLTVQGRIAGAITFAHSESGRRYGPGDLLLGEEIARRAALAVENARLHRASQNARLVAEGQRAALEWWEKVFEHAGWGVALTDARTGLLHAINPAFARMHGYAPDELVGTPLRTIFAPGHEAELQRQAAIAEETGRAMFESVHRRKDGTLFPVFIDVVALRDPGGRVIRAANVIDISERRQIEDERARLLESEQAARAQAEQASRAKDEFLAMLGHELRNPLSPIVTAMQLMKLRGRESTGREQEIIERQVRHLVRLVDDLLDVSRITRGKIALSKRPVELCEVVVKAVEMASPLFVQRSQILALDVPRAGLCVLADPDRLAQVVTNLLTNAAKYTPPGGRIEVVARRDDPAAEVQLRVIDNGTGIAPELLPQVFDLFVQGARSPERSEGGLGIGLALVKSLVQLHGGSVAASSRGPDRGSEFTVRLPLHEERTQEPAAVAEAPFGKASSPLRVLLVDDNRDAAELTAEMLREAGYGVTVAFDPMEALSSVSQDRPDVAILDVGLPVMDGYELARQIRGRVTGAPPRFIAVTGYGQDSDRARSDSAGFACHLVKPVDPDELVRAIEQASAGA
jgi:PAS domain S-box-containing protein